MSRELLRFDEEASRRVEATYLTADVVEQRRALLATLALRPGERVLDIGSGPGLLAREMAAAVGPGGAVDGVDASESMLALTRAREPLPGSAPMRFVGGDARELPFADGAFDVAVSTQVYEYVDDIPRALAEARRVLRPGGRLLVLDTDWDSIVWHSRDPGRTRRVLEAWEEHLVHPDLPRRLPGLLRAAGLRPGRPSVIPILNAGEDRDTYSAGLAGVIAAFVPGRRGVSEAEARAWAEDVSGMGEDTFFSLNRYVLVATR